MDGQRARGGYRSGAGLLRLRCVYRADLFPLWIRSCGCGRIIGAVGRRVATRLGLQSKSFDLAATAFGDAVGRGISGDSVARLTEGWGQAVEAQRNQEAERANQPGRRGERLTQQRLAEVTPITTQANLSTDGAMMLVREEGWKEVKVVAVSAVRPKPAVPPVSARPSRRDDNPRIELWGHSYHAGLWDADTMAVHQYAEGLRRGLDYCPKRSSVNDGALWIKRITTTNFPGVPQVVQLVACGQSPLGGRQCPPRRPDPAGPTVDGTTLGPAVGRPGCAGRECAGSPGSATGALAGLGAHSARLLPFQSRAHALRPFPHPGLPIGSGTVKSAANTVVHHRLRRPGRGWTRTNGQAMLAALSELHSGRYEYTWLRLAKN